MILNNLVSKITSSRVIVTTVILGLITYLNTLFNGFVWDDEEEIVNNPIIHSFSNLPYIWSGATFNTGGAGLSGWFFRPVRTIFMMLNYSLWGPNPFGFHLFNILGHIGCTILLFKILTNLLINTKYKIAIAGIVSIIFLVNSANTEAVNYIASPDVLAAFFSLLFFYLIIKFHKKALTIKKTAILLPLLLASFMIKESSLVISLITISYLYIYNSSKKRRYTVLIIISLLIYLFIRLVIAQTPFRALDMSPIAVAPLSERLTTVPLTIILYLKTIFFPNYLAISQHFVIKQFTSTDFYLPFLILALTFSLIGYLSLKYDLRLTKVGLVWAVLSFGMIANIFPLDMTIGERFLYFPYLGVSLIVADLLNHYIKTNKLALTLLIIFIIITPLLIVRTIIRNSNWYDGLTLYSHDYQINPTSYDVANNLGVELYREGDYQKSKPLFEQSLQSFPKWYFAKNNLGAVYQSEKDYPKAEQLYKEVLKQADYYLAYQNLSEVLLLQGKYQEAETDTKTALAKLPNNPLLWLYLAVAEYKLNKKDDALQAVQNSYQLNPSKNTQALYNQISQDKPVDFN